MSQPISRRRLLGGLAGVGLTAMASSRTSRAVAAPEWEQVVAPA